VRLVKGDDEKIIVVAVLFHKVERTGHHAPAVCKFGVNAFVVHGLRKTGFYTVVVAAQFRKIAAHVVPVVGIPAVGAYAVAEVVASVKMPFADVGGVEAAVVQALTDGVNIVAERHAVCPRAAG